MEEGIKLIEHSANQDFAPAEKMLAFIILKGELLPRDEKQAFNLLLHSAALGDDKAEYALAKLLLKSDVIPKDTERAVELLKSAAEQGNEYAATILQNQDNYLKYSMAMSAMRLFGYIGNLFGKKFNTDKSKTGFRIDKKQYAQIQEKKMAQGLK